MEHSAIPDWEMGVREEEDEHIVSIFFYGQIVLEVSLLGGVALIPVNLVVFCVLEPVLGNIW